jgi:putative nucleotidyltransferase-like protein
MSFEPLAACAPHQRLAMALLSGQPARWIPEGHDRFLASVSWRDFLAETDDRIQPYLDWVSRKSPFDKWVPAQVREALAEQHRIASMRTLRWTAELREIVSTFARDGISLMLVKGAALQRTVYPLPSTRPMGDIDLVVRREELPRICEAMTRLGFALRSPPDHQTPMPGLQVDEETYFVKQVGDSVLMIETHTRLDFGNSDFAASPLSIWETRSEIRGNDGLMVVTPEPHTALRHLCIHVAKQHAFERGLLWLLDLSLFVAHHGANLQWPRFLQECSPESRPYVTSALVLASDWLGAKVPEQIAADLPEASRAAVKNVAWEQVWDFVRTRRPPSSLVLLGMSGDWRRIAAYLKDKWRRWTLPVPGRSTSAWVLAAKRFRTELKTYGAAARQGGLGWQSLATVHRIQRRTARLQALLSDTGRKSGAGSDG